MEDFSMATFGGLTLCVTKKTPAVLTSVTPIRPTGGFVIQAWGIRPNPYRAGGYGIGSDRKPLSAFPGFTHGKVTARCGSTQPPPEIAVQVARPGEQTANSDALRVHYTMNGRASSMVIPYRYTLCAPTDHVKWCSPKG